MPSLPFIAFAQPWLLLALAGLPIIWLLLRITPPAPRAQRFPAIALLLGLRPPEETPARTPLWLTLLRMLIAALIVLGLAHPLFNPSDRLSGTGPLLLVLDDGWAAARHWPAREAALESLLEQAQREDRSVIMLRTAPDALDQPITASSLLSAAEARRAIRGLQPKPWPVDRAAALAAVDRLALPGPAHVVWLSDGLDDGHAAALAARLQSLGRLDLFDDGPGQSARLVLPPESDSTGLQVRLRRAAGTTADAATILAEGDDGGLIARVPLAFAPGQTVATARVDLPLELRNRIARMSIEGEAGVGAVLLLDERWRRRPVGLVAVGVQGRAQPLLSEIYYLQRALEPFVELRRGSVEELLQRELAVVVLPDGANLGGQVHARLRAWIEGGGLLLRFAGPRLAEASTRGGDDPLLPTRLRVGGRSLSGVLTWDEPARLAPFPAGRPLAGLPLPGDIVIQRQVLAEPTLDLGEKTWARLSDGTPLITAARRGEGWVVLVHTSANTDWSNLPLSGLFVEMLRRIVAVSHGVAARGQARGALPPIATLDAFGRLGPPPPSTLALDQETSSAGRIDPRHPPGYYGTAGIRQAHNMAAADPTLRPMTGISAGVNRAAYGRARETDLQPWLLSLALVLLLADLGIALAMRGLLGQMMWRGAVVALLVAALPAVETAAQGESRFGSDDARALEATLETHLAYVVTGVAAVDEVSRAGLDGLTRILQLRTSVEAGRPLPVDLARDELAFFPLLYWPIAPEQRDLSDVAARKVNTFLRGGGTILFDLREPGAGIQIFGRASRNGQALQRLTKDLEIPPLVPVPPDHVLTKSFYLMQDFPGRFADGALWLDAADAQVNDGVASVLIGSNDWAGAWAANEFGQFLFPVVPGGERQRELAYRFGVNLVMYAMTGNYKADQVHVPFILERLGQ